MSFLGEIKRRKVFQVAAVYAVVAWLIIQIIDVVSEPLSLPDWLDTVVIVLLIVGFPVALVLAWALDLTPHGVIRTPPSNTEDRKAADARDLSGNRAEAEQDILPHSVAVLPFENLSPNPDDAYFAAGIHEEILNHLTKIKDISVIARTSVMQYEGARQPVAEIARALRVGTVMEGSVRYAGDRVRVTAQLIDASTGAHLWSESYDRDLSDIFAVQTDVAIHISATLEAELSPHEKKILEVRPTQSTEAYALYLRAITLYLEGGDLSDPTGAPSMRDSVQAYLDRAIAADPDFALAHAWKARLYTASLENDLVGVGQWPAHRAMLHERIRNHAETALAIDPGIGLAHTSLGVLYFNTWRGAEASQAFTSSVGLSPNDTGVLINDSFFKFVRDEFEESKQVLERVLELDPRDPQIYLVLGWIQQIQGDHEVAADTLRRGIAVNPAVPLCRHFLARLEVARGDLETALKELKTVESLVPDESAPIFWGDLAWGYGRTGASGDAERIFGKLEQLSKTCYVDPAVWAWAYLSLRDYERAFELLKSAAEEPALVQNTWIFHHTRLNAWSDPAINEPRFQDLFKRLWVTE